MNDMNGATWNKLSAGTVQCMPESGITYQVLKVRAAVTNPPEFVTTYLVLKLTERDWLALQPADTFSEAKQIAQADYAMVAV